MEKKKKIMPDIRYSKTTKASTLNEWLTIFLKEFKKTKDDIDMKNKVCKTVRIMRRSENQTSG